MHGDLSALRKPEMQIFCWFNFLTFLLVQFSSSPILGSISTFQTFMGGHLCVVTFLPHESPMCSFTLPDIFTLPDSLYYYSWSCILAFVMSLSNFNIFYIWTKIKWKYFTPYWQNCLTEKNSIIFGRLGILQTSATVSSKWLVLLCEDFNKIYQFMMQKDF